MKTSRILFALSLTILAFTAQAQIKVIPKVGVNFSGVGANLNDFRAEARVGWNAGLDFRIGSRGPVFLYPGIQFNNYTARLITNISKDPSLRFQDETTIQAIKAPLDLGIRLNRKNALLNLVLRGGVTPTMIVGVQEKNGIAFNKSSLNQFTWGANAGLSLDVLFLTVDLNYELGLNNYFATAQGRNNVFSVSAGIRF
jgi:hypothetical protein